MYGAGIDTGGTFTDLVAIDRRTGEVRIDKRPSTPDAPSRATLEVLQSTFSNQQDVHGIVLGTTIAANAQLRSGGASTLYVTTRGFEDIPFIQRVARKEAYNPSWKKPAPGVLRRHTFGVAERTLHTGEIELDLAEAELERLGDWVERWTHSDSGDDATESRQWSVALNLLFSYANPEHERRIVEYLTARFAALPVSASHNVCPTWREYERATTTIVDARIKPMLRDFTEELRQGLEQTGFACPLSLMKSNGGHAEASSVTERSVDLLLSGLAGGIIGGQHVADRHGSANAVTLDMGGTSCDVGVIVDGAFKATTAYEVEWGVPISAPFIDYTCIGAGGGSIAEIDAGGLLRVGPESAGAEPGPASYGRGGERATVTDANLVLGRLDPKFFLGGSMPLEPERARFSLEPLSDRLELSPDDAALAVIETTNQNMAGAIRLLTVERGLDHRDFDLVAFGGAGALHAVELASGLGMRRVIVPPNPGLYSALGTLIADFRVDKALTVMHRSDHDQLEELSAQLVGLTAGALDELHRDGYEGSLTVVGQLNMRYHGQNFGELITVQAGELDVPAFEAAIQSFHQKHEDLYGYALPDTVVEVTEVRALAIGTREPPPAHTIASGTLADPLTRRAVSFPGHGSLDSAIYRRADLSAGVRIGGPAVIEDTDSTTVLPPEAELLVASDGSLIIDVGTGQAALASRVAAGAADSVTLSVVNNHLRNICDEMVTAMVQTAHSPIFSESRGFSCMLFNRDLELIGQAEMNPAIICAGLHTVPFTVEELGIDTFRPGDVIVHNDPYRGSCHMPEHLLLKPIFIEERLVGFAANIAHIAEIGGMAVGSFASTATEVFQEGLRTATRQADG